MGGRGSSSRLLSGGSSFHGEKVRNSFFGEAVKTSGKYIKPTKMVNGDEITIITDNVKVIKGNPVLVVGSNKAVYLKEWNVAGVGIKNGQGEYVGDSLAVKINKKYFKPYTFKTDFDYFGETESFESLKKAAKKQEKSKNTYAPFMIVIDKYSVWKHKTQVNLGMK